MFLSGAWTDVSQYVYQRSTLTLSRGRVSETDAVQPSALRLVLDNRTGNFSPRNPRSIYYGQLGRNSPIRMFVRQINDTFTRTVSGGWGTADTGQVWTTVDGAGGTVQASDWNTTGTTATHNVPAASGYRNSHFAGAKEQYPDADVQVDVSIPVTTPTGGNLEIGNIILRRQSSANYYIMRAQVTTAPAVQLVILTAAGTVLAGPLTIAGVTNTANTFLTVRGQIEEQTIRGKIWLTSAGEPKDWQLTVQDATYTGAGSVGVRSGVSAGNTNVPVVFTMDNVQMRHVRFRGEVSAWPQTWDQSGTDIVINLEAAGVIRRLNQGTTPAISAPRQYIRTTNPIAYWSLEDQGNLTKAGQPDVGAYPFSSVGGTQQKWGQGTLAPWLAPSLQGFSLNTIQPDGKFSAVITPTGLVDRLTVDWLVSGVGSHSVSIVPSNNVTDPRNWQCSFSNISGNLLFGPPVGNTSGSVSTPAYIFSNDLWHVRFTVIDQGSGNNFWSVWVNGILANSGVTTGPGIGFLTLPPLMLVVDTINGNSAGVGVTIGHVAAYYGNGPAFPGPVTAAQGYPGESAGNRISRLCTNNGITFTNVGNLTNTTPMGPQQAAPLLTLITDAATADAGILYESRGDLGLCYRTRQSLYNEPVNASLSVTGAHNLSAPIAPVDDDRYIRNDITITRQGGAAQRVTQPLGTLGTAAPPVGVGAYTDSATVNLLFDPDALQLAGWRLGLGTWDEARYPAIKTNFNTLPLTLRGLVAALTTGQRLQISNPETWLPPDLIDLLVQGTTENLNKYQWDITITCSPFGPYRVGVLNDAVLGNLDTAGSQLNSGATSSATSLSVATSSGPIWVQGAVNFDIRVAGERITVTNISGAASPQTFTVTRSVNGISKSQVAGTAVSLWQPFYLAL